VGRRKYGEAAKALMDRWNVSDPYAAIQLAAQDLLARAEIDEPPTDLELVGSFVGIAKVVRRKMRQSARLIPGPNGYLVELNTQEHIKRQRFSHAHEIGHLLIPTYTDDPKLREDQATGQYWPRRQEESLCDRAASELLLPLARFQNEVIQHGANIATLQYLSDLFEVSLEAVAIRCTQCGAFEGAIIVWHEKLSAEQRKEQQRQTMFPEMEAYRPQPALRIHFAAVSAGLRGHRFARNALAPNGAPFSLCSSADHAIVGDCDLPEGKRMVRWHTESISAPYLSGGVLQERVITMAFPA